MTLLLVSCGSPPRVAVEERSTITVRQQTDKIGGSVVRLVEPGDTMYSIAFAAGLNVNDIAAWNGISDTSKLQVGRKIRLTKPLNFVPPKPVATTKSSSPVRNTSPKAVPIESKSSGQTIKPALPSMVRWNWPTQGRVIARFASASSQQGIDIEGNLGQSVVSAGDGEVVYVGNGLKGYGNLIIIKHNAQYLSAYAHNREYFVREGERVKAKQVIASLGKNNRQKNALHFQIRKDGKPVDPQRYLAKK